MSAEPAVGPGRVSSLVVAPPEVAAFVFLECRLLDERRFDEWLELFDDDCTYEIPYPGASPEALKVMIAHDDRERLAERLWRLESGEAHSQNPPSETARLVGNLVVDGGGGDVTVTGTFVLAEVRRDVQRTYAGRYVFDLRRGGDSFRIGRKRVELVNAGAPHGNMTFVL